MSPDTGNAERHLQRDLEQLGDRLVDESFCCDLYRALAGNRWSRKGEPDVAVALSWTRAERLVNELRDRRGEAPLALAQTGGEGGVGGAPGDELDRLGWAASPLDTSRQDPAHSSEPAPSPPPRGQGEAQSPVDDSRGWEREAHREADASRARHPSAPGRGTGAGGDSRARSEKS